MQQRTSFPSKPSLLHCENYYIQSSIFRKGSIRKYNLIQGRSVGEDEYNEDKVDDKDDESLTSTTKRGVKMRIIHKRKKRHSRGKMGRMHEDKVQ